MLCMVDFLFTDNKMEISCYMCCRYYMCDCVIGWVVTIRMTQNKEGVAYAYMHNHSSTKSFFEGDKFVFKFKKNVFTNVC